MTDKTKTTKDSEEKLEEGSKEGSEEECPHCDGEGYITISRDDPEFEELKDRYGDKAWAYRTQKRCICTKREKFKEQVGPTIYNAEKLEDSFLWDRTGEDLFVQSYRADFLPHFRYVLVKKGLDFFWRMTDDAELRDIYVGNHDDYESLSDCVRQPRLVVINLAILSYENVAMPGILLESLRIREKFEEKSTWILNPPDEPFNEGHEAYSPKLERYISERFNKISIGRRDIDEENSNDERADSKKVEGNADFGGLM